MTTIERKRKYDYEAFTNNVVKCETSEVPLKDVLLSEEDKNQYSLENFSTNGFYIGKIDPNEIDKFMVENGEDFHQLLVNDQMRQPIFNEAALEILKSSNIDQGRYQIPSTMIKRGRLKSAITNLSNIVRDKVVNELESDNKKVNDSDPFNVLLTINKTLKEKLQTETAQRFHEHMDNINNRKENSKDPDQLLVPRQMIHVDLPYDDEYHNKYLTVLPLLKIGAKVRVVTASHRYESWPEFMRRLVSTTDAKAAHRTIVIPLTYGEFICFHPKLVHSGWEANFNVRLHTYIGFNSKKIKDNATYYIPHLIYPYFRN